MKQRILTALAVIAVALGFFALGDIGFMALIIAVLAFAAYELYSLIKSQVKPIIYPIMLVFMIATPFMSIYNLVSLICGLFLVLALLMILTKWFTMDIMSLIFIMSTLIMMAIYSAVNLFMQFGYLAFFWILVANYLTDTMAYFIGVKFGKHKMIPSVSPNKTWEGALGGYFGGLIGSLVFGYFLDFDYEFIILASLLIPIVAQLGDLFFSSIKRQYNIKDFGTLLPSHGGILDRIDSLVFSLLLMMLLLNAWGIFL